MKCPYPVTIRSPSLAIPTSHIAVPCGKCGICMKNKTTEWYIRLKEETKKNLSNSFLTLTYNDDEIPEKGVDKEEIQRFIKRLRHEYDFKYYLIAEYGPKTGRPHYHALLFGIDIWTKPKKTNLTTIKLLEKIWKHGNIKIDTIEAERIHYVAEYHVLRYGVPDGLNTTFSLMSKNLGNNYLQEQNNFHVFIDQMYYRNGNFKLALPRYYKERLYPKSERIKKTIQNQEMEYLKELQEYQKDPMYYRKRWESKKFKIKEYLNKTNKNKLI